LLSSREGVIAPASKKEPSLNDPRDGVHPEGKGLLLSTYKRKERKRNFNEKKERGSFHTRHENL